MSKIALVLVRGLIGISSEIKETLFRLGLKRKFSCTVVEDTPVNLGMIQKVKDYVTFGSVTEETHKMLIEKRGEKDLEGNVKKMFRLHPPRGGFERKGIKKSFVVGGVLGNRKEKMNDLIQKMI